METVSPQKVNFAINYLNTLPFLFRCVTSLQDLGEIVINGLRQGLDKKVIASLTGLSLEAIEKIAQNIHEDK
jgi:hypothetical protein